MSLYKYPSHKDLTGYLTSKKENAYIDLNTLEQMKTPAGRKIIIEVRERKIELCTQSPEPYHGSGSKIVVVNRFVELDDLFFEGLGLWVGEGGKSKGLYFGNTCPELLLRFLDFAEIKLGLSQSEFKVTLNASTSTDTNMTREKWSKTLQIPVGNFTRVCVDQRINKEYAQFYLNSVVLVEIMNALLNMLRLTILANEKFASAFLRGVFAGEGQVALKKWGTLFHVSFASADENLVALLKEYLKMLDITSGKYMKQSLKFPIYGYRNLKRFKELGIHTLHPDKRAKFERGFANYKRVNVLKGEEARKLILQQLASGPKTYDDLAAALGKARTTIQAHHIPILEKQGLVKRAGKRGHAWLWTLTEDKRSPSTKINR